MAADRDSAGLTYREGPAGGPGTVPHDAHGPTGDAAAGGDEQKADRGEGDPRCRRPCGEPRPERERGEAGEGQPEDRRCSSPGATPLP